MGIVLAGFMMDWLTIALDLKKLQRIAKPLAMVLLILWTLLLARDRSYYPLGLLIVAQIFGLIGDVSVFFSGKWLYFSLAAFLTGHLLYIGNILVALTGLFQSGAEIKGLLFPVLMYLLTNVVILILFYWVFKPMRNPEKIQPALWTAIQVYAWVLSELVALVVFFMLLSKPGSLQLYFLPVGVFLFLLSESLWVYTKFIYSFKNAHLWVHITYHLAQFSLAIGFLSII